MVAVDHEYLAGADGLDALVTDRSDASGTGYWSPADNGYRPDLLTLALGHEAIVPRVLAAAGVAGRAGSATLAAGCGDGEIIPKV